MRDLLHDRIDAREELISRAAEIVRTVIAEKLDEALSRGEDIREALTLLAAHAANALADLTTEAVRAGYDHAIARAAISDQNNQT